MAFRDIENNLRCLCHLFMLLLVPGLPLSVSADTMTTNLTPCPDKPNCVSSLDAERDSFIEPFEYTGDASAAKVRLMQVLGGLPRTEVIADEENYLHVTFTSGIFGFVDDVEFLIDDNQKLIQVRSASRSGKYDFGVNRRRVEMLRNRFSETASNDSSSIEK